VRIDTKGRRTFVVVKRFPGAKHPTRRSIGVYGVIGLAEARDQARKSIKLITKGIDPTEEARRIAKIEADKRASTFGAVVEDYISQHLSAKRRGQVDAREIRRELLPQWRDRHVGDITRADVIALIRPLALRAPATARNVLSHVKRIYVWAIHECRYGIDQSPAQVISPKLLIGEKKPRQRVLNDDELRALLKATEILGYPIGECVRLILLTGCRLREIGEARWSEIDFAARLLIIPPERFKSGVSHRVPLSEDALQLLKGLPLRGEFLFTFTGSRPINGWSRAKDALDAHMEIDDLPDWKIHDLRHTMRTRMAAMRIPDIIAEMCLGHGKRGLQRVYDQYGYEPEIRDALQRWAALLRGIVEPVNVIELRRA
jgi:integrase